MDLKQKRAVFCDNCDNHSYCKKLNYKINGVEIIPQTWYGLRAIELLTNKNIAGQIELPDSMPNIVYESVIVMQEYKIFLNKKELKNGK